MIISFINVINVALNSYSAWRTGEVIMRYDDIGRSKKYATD